MSEHDSPATPGYEARKSAATLWIILAIPLSATNLLMGIEWVTGGQPDPTQSQQHFDMASVSLVDLGVMGGLALLCWAMAISKFAVWGKLIAFAALIVVVGSLLAGELNSMSAAELDSLFCTTMFGACD